MDVIILIAVFGLGALANSYGTYKGWFPTWEQMFKRVDR